MPYLLLKELPRYECLLAASEKYPTLNPAAAEAFLNLLRTSDLIVGAENGYLSGHGISQGRFMVLMLLNGNCKESLSPAELADKSGVTRATMTGLLDIMERDGLVTRTMSSTDRRAIEVAMTPHGHELIDSVLPGYFKRVDEMLSPLSAPERRLFVYLLQKLQSAFGDSAPAERPAPSILQS